MQTVTSIHLNGKVYQLEEGAYLELRRYLDQAASHLAGNPDLTEIMTDLEHAIGDKCQSYLRADKDVVTEGEMSQILKEMGPVDGEADQMKSEAGGASAFSGSQKRKRFFLVREGAVMAGVCTGIAAYFDIDVTWVRLAFVGLTLVTGGGWVLLYIVLAVVVPYANSYEERAMAHGGAPMTAQDIIHRARETYQRVAKKHGWE